MPGFQSGFQVGFQQVNPITTDGLHVYIENIDRTNIVRSIRNIDLSYTLNARAVARFELLQVPVDNTTAYRPGDGLTVIIRWWGETIFSGFIVTVEDAPLGETDFGVVTKITATDFASVLDDRLLTAQYDPGGLWTLRQIIADIVADKLAVFGITIDPLMGDGPFLTSLLTFDNVTVQSAFGTLMQWTGYMIRVTPDKVVEAFQPGTVVAPYSLTAVNSTIRGGVTWSKTRTKYVNTIAVRYGGTQRAVRTDSWTADGVLDTFFLDELSALMANGLPETRGLVRVTEGGVARDETLHGVWTFHQSLDPDGLPIHAIEANYVPALNALIELTYVVQYPHDVTVMNATEVAARGPREERVDAPDVISKTDARALGLARLSRSAIIPRVARLKTWEGMVYPGDTVPLNIPSRTLTGNWFLTEVRVRDVASDVLEYDLTCVEGNEAQFTWIDYFRNWSGGAASNGGTISGTWAPAPSTYTGQAATGSWQTEPYSGSYFGVPTGSGMTWTVEDADEIVSWIIDSAYKMTVNINIKTSTVGGTPSDLLQVRIPQGYVSKREMQAFCRLYDNGAYAAGVMAVAAGQFVIYIARLDAANFTAATNTVMVQGQIHFDIQA